MRNRLIVLFSVLFFEALSVGWAVERPWQEISEPTVGEVSANFASPRSEYALTVWWGWDGPVTEAVIIRDLDMMKERGIRSVLIEAGYGMSEPYLSPGWFELIRLAIDHARRRGMCVWVEDEGKYPSGFAGGKFTTERPDLRMQAIVVAERVEVASGEMLSRKLPGEVVGAVAVNMADNSIQHIDVTNGELKWKAPEGRWQVLLARHDFCTSPTRSVSNLTRGKDTSNSLGDYLNPAATRQFLAWTHEQYKKYIGSEFGRTFLGFMGDEPDYSISGIPWTPRIFTEFEQRKGYDVRPWLASFFAPRLTEESRRVKADYWDVWSDLFRENFFRVQADWCTDNNIEYMVHLNHEHIMPSLVRSEGDYFKDMRYVQIPGVDTIWNQIWPGNVSDFPKYASSVAHVFGRPRTFSESFAAYRTAPNVEQAKWVIDYQLVRGINLIQVMFWSSSAGGRGGPRGWMASDGFPAVVEYTNRACYLLSQGRPAAQVALYYPTSSLWLGDNDANMSVLTIARQLLERQRDFDFVDEQALSSVMTLEGGAFKNLSGQSYRTVIIPSVSAISKAALDRLRAFAASGGRVIFLGREPSMVVEKTFLKAAGPTDLGWAVREPSGELTARVIEALPRPDVALDQPCPSVKYLHRHLRDGDVYFFFNESAEKQSRKVMLAGSGQAQVWDAASGRTETQAADCSEDGFVRLPLELKLYETKFIVIGAIAPPLRPLPTGRPIDRHALVTRHNVTLDRADPLTPLSVGNGEFAFTADITGLQTFPEYHRHGMPLGTLSQWGWHTMPNPQGYKLSDVLEEYEVARRKVPYASDREFSKDYSTAASWLRANPHRLHLGQIGLRIIKSDKSAVDINDLTNASQTLDLWSGLLTSRFEIESQPVRVFTVCHPRRDLLAVRIESLLLGQDRLLVSLAFPYGSADWRNAADWNHPERHTTQLDISGHQANITRILDADRYYVRAAWSPSVQIRAKSQHEYEICEPNDQALEIVFAFSPTQTKDELPGFEMVRAAAADNRRQFWTSGGAIDFSQCTDPRAAELERRIVLSQYLTAIQCSGSIPPQETGLVCNSWFGKFHLEMHWWHAVHFALWDRLPLLERSLPWYQSILPTAKATAERQGYRGVRWPKMVSPDGRESPSQVGVFLIWQQPHPIYYAELCYRARGDRETLERYRQIVFETAEFMASYPVWDETGQRYVLGPALIPAQESYSRDRTRNLNPTFELAYWYWGLETAQKWRERLGLERDPKWERVIRNLSHPNIRDGVYTAIETPPYTIPSDHPSMLAAFGFVPETPLIDPNIMRRTFDHVIQTWKWSDTWGWDYPMLAMTAARLGEPEKAVDALFIESQKNRFLANGHNLQSARLPLYLPGNGGLLTAVAMMAAGWDGCPAHPALGFPDNGKWNVRWEGLKRMP